MHTHSWWSGSNGEKRHRLSKHHAGTHHKMWKHAQANVSFFVVNPLSFKKVSCNSQHPMDTPVHTWSTFWRNPTGKSGFCVAGAKESAPRRKWTKPVGSVLLPKATAGVGHVNRICKGGFRMAPSETLRGQGAAFLRRGAFWSIRSSDDLASLFFCGTRTSQIIKMEWKNAHCTGTKWAALRSTSHCLRKSRRNDLFFWFAN